MTAHRPRPKRPPRIAQTAIALAEYLDHSPGWLSMNMEKLSAVGFPPRDDLLDGWDLNAVDHWIDQRSGIIPGEGLDFAALQRRELEREFGIGSGAGSLPS